MEQHHFEPQTVIPPDHRPIDDDISRAVFDLLLREPFYAHVLAGMPRVVSENVETIGLKWNGQLVVLQVNPEWFCNELAAAHLVKRRSITLFRSKLTPAARKVFEAAGSWTYETWTRNR